MNSKDSLGDRMKRYESITDYSLISLSPVIIRLDGRSFHSLTRGLDKPYDEFFINAMNNTAKKLCEEIQNCRLAYVQSDEISLVLLEKNYEAEAWFDNRLNKILSISSSIATKTFTFNLMESCLKGSMVPKKGYEKLFEDGMFDARAFNLSKEEVTNYFIWRQNDCIRNAKTMYAQTYIPSKQLHGKSAEERIELANSVTGKDFYKDMPIGFQRGRCIVKRNRFIDLELTKTRPFWYIDENIPLFKEDRNYIENELLEEDSPSINLVAEQDRKAFEEEIMR